MRNRTLIIQLQVAFLLVLIVATIVIAPQMVAK